MKPRSYFRVTAVAATIALGVVGLSACGSSSKSSNAPASGATGATTDSGTATGSPIKIGTIGVYSGFSAQTTVPTSLALQAWASYTNAHGGINGHPVQVIVKDDAGVSSKSLAAAKELIQSDHVVAIVGQNESGLEDVWAPYAASQKVPVIGGPAGGTSWLTNPNSFPTGLTAVNNLTVIANAANIAGKKNYGIVYCAEVPACAQASTLSKPIAQKLGLNYAGAIGIAATSTSYAAPCLKLKGDGADAIFLASDINTSLRFVAACTAQNYDFTPIDDARNWSAPQLKNPVWKGAVLTSEGPLWFGDGPAIQTYLAAMKQYQPNAIANSNGPLGWAAGVVFGAAAKAGSTAGATVTAADVLKGLYTLGPDYTAGGLIPPVTYTAGKPATQKPCGWYAQVVNGALTAPKGSGQICIGS